MVFRIPFAGSKLLGTLGYSMKDRIWYIWYGAEVSSWWGGALYQTRKVTRTIFDDLKVVGARSQWFHCPPSPLNPGLGVYTCTYVPCRAVVVVVVGEEGEKVE